MDWSFMIREWLLQIIVTGLAGTGILSKHRHKSASSSVWGKRSFSLFFVKQLLACIFILSLL